MKIKKITTIFLSFIAFISLILICVIQFAPWIWRNFPVARKSIYPIIVKQSIKWKELNTSEVTKKLGAPFSREGSITVFTNDKSSVSEKFQWIPITTDEKFDGRDARKFSEIVSNYKSISQTIDQKVTLLQSMSKFGNIEDFRIHYKNIQTPTVGLILEEQWIYNIGESDLGRSLRVNFDQDGKLKHLETFFKDAQLK